MGTLQWTTCIYDEIIHQLPAIHIIHCYIFHILPFLQKPAIWYLPQQIHMQHNLVAHPLLLQEQTIGLLLGTIMYLALKFNMFYKSL